MAKTIPLPVRLWEKIDKRGADECWLWTGYKNVYGYGCVTVARKSVKAHRLVYENTVGQIPDGMCVCHRCDVPSCCNPAHLFLGTHSDNMADKRAKRRGRSVGVKGESHWKSSLTKEQIFAIRKINARHGLIASLYGVTRRAIGNIKSGRTWASVTETMG